MDISKITDYLYISASLQTGHVNELDTRNISLIISMIGGRRPPDMFAHSPYQLLWLQTFDSLLIPIPMSKLMQGVRMALETIQNKGSVLVYCAQGRHRSVAMAAAILIAMGYTASEAVDLLCTQRQAADPKTWHIYQRIEAFEKYWRNELSRPDSMGEVYCEFATTLASNVVLYFI
jgi:protein-tyrosine phosphatase